MTQTRADALTWISPSIRDHAVPLESIRQDAQNVRVHNAKNLAAIQTSLKRFGQQKPIVCDQQRVVRAGNGTMLAAIANGETHIAAVFSDLSEAELQAYAIADNRTAELAEWDEAKLAAALQSLGVDLANAAGFVGHDLSKALAEGAREATQDECPEPPATPTTKPGDLWILGNHRLLCGDSTNPADVDRLMNGEKAALVSTDPPYLVDYTGERPGKEGGKDWSESYREIDIKDARGFFTAVFSNVLRIIAPKAAIYCWHAHKRQALIAEIWRQLGILDHQQIIWVKPSSVLGRVFWHFRHEPCMMGWIQGSQPEHDGQHWFNSVWVSGAPGVADLEDLSKRELVDLVKKLSSVWEIDWEGKARVVGNEHPTQKPVEIFARPMRKHTAPGAVCYEPFSGSGSQIVAGEQMGRRVFAMELSPIFVDVAMKRWERFTGREAIRTPAEAVEESCRVA